MEPPEDSFAFVLVKARKKKGVSRAEMARLYQAKPTVITRLESGRNSASEATVKRYLAALGLRPVLRFEPIPEAG